MIYKMNLDLIYLYVVPFETFLQFFVEILHRSLVFPQHFVMQNLGRVLLCNTKKLLGIMSSLQ